MRKASPLQLLRAKCNDGGAAGIAGKSVAAPPKCDTRHIVQHAAELLVLRGLVSLAVAVGAAFHLVQASRQFGTGGSELVMLACPERENQTSDSSIDQGATESRFRNRAIL